MIERIPQATAKRLPLYYRTLQHLYSLGKNRISSSEFSQSVQIDSATIRRDLSYLGALGKKGYGYDVGHLINFLRGFLNQDEVTEVILIGVGNLGTALLNYNFHKNNNTRIIRAYDIDEAKIGKKIADTPIYHLDDLLNGDNKHIPAAILTVPASAAQIVADKLVLTGIRGILNFTPVRLSLPDHILIHHIDLSVELQSMVYLLKNYPLNPLDKGGE
ncbi:redox-sensing transcriptional repressor [Scopulibacillus daqui]|uniref:Redox-sensing transcriptional repressor Rex n=1 Tax=Scopulibacillus daqui TaxID=1469162 RepID=A0ABS2Q2R9_9BACL|nr:redox-sensing transcriptional repressor Rex [Scopulibacillus daqui]MBM7646589.1 redox-sensing transcriptional repressor [Scopulibacillus daqui]